MVGNGLVNPTGQSYDPITNNWGDCEIMPSKRINVDVAVVNDMIYTVGGFTPIIGSNIVASAEN
jgi:hypothetical protein